MINRVVNHTQTLLRVAKQQLSVKSFVMTSSSSAAIVPVPNQPGIRVDENTWNEDAIRAAWNPDYTESDKAYMIYAASKTEAERAAWRWIEDHKPGFSFNTILPNWTVRDSVIIAVRKI